MEQRSEGKGGAMICEKCGASFETQEELDRHVQEAHPDERTEKES
jgi:DNA-directed RNA polymerase subunit M/transcription elongation factor TFIIS